MTTIKEVREKYQVILNEKLEELNNERLAYIKRLEKHYEGEQLEDWINAVNADFSEEREFLIKKYERIQERVKLYK